jgi:uncharacterized membrane protein
MLKRFMATFFAGLFALLPLVITISLVGFLVTKLVSWVGPSSAFGQGLASIYPRLELTYPASLVLVIVLITIVGYFARRVAGQRIAWLFEWIIGRIPFINKVYHSVEQIIGLLQKGQGDAASALSNVVMAHIANVRVLGMLSSSDPVLLDGVPHYIVYIPSTPIPASGQNLLVPCADVEDVDISMEELTKILLSLGSLGPGIMSSKAQLILPNPALIPPAASAN